MSLNNKTREEEGGWGGRKTKLILIREKRPDMCPSVHKTTSQSRANKQANKQHSSSRNREPKASKLKPRAWRVLTGQISLSNALTFICSS